MDALRWNMLNIIRVELFINCYTIWRIFVKGEISSSRGQYAIVSLIITLAAQFTVQFNFAWLLTVYATYLAVGLGYWLHRRVYFYHRRFDLLGITQTLRQYDCNVGAGVGGGSIGGGSNHNNGHANTLKPNKHTGSDSSSSNSATSTSNPEYNSLQRQRVSAYRNFQSVLTEPRYNHKEFALSLAHLSDVSKLVADKDVFDEMHFQILATRRDVVNIILRATLLTASLALSYLH